MQARTSAGKRPARTTAYTILIALVMAAMVLVGIAVAQSESWGADSSSTSVTHDEVVGSPGEPVTVTLDRIDNGNNINMSFSGSFDSSVVSEVKISDTRSDKKFDVIITISSTGAVGATTTIEVTVAKKNGETHITRIPVKIAGNLEDSSFTFISPITLTYGAGMTTISANVDHAAPTSVSIADSSIADVLINASGQLLVTPKAVGETTLTISGTSTDPTKYSDPPSQTITLKVLPAGTGVLTFANEVSLVEGDAEYEVGPQIGCSATTQNALATNASSNDTSVVTARVDNGKLYVSPMSAGTAQITISGVGAMGYNDPSPQTITVTVSKQDKGSIELPKDASGVEVSYVTFEVEDTGAKEIKLTLTDINSIVADSLDTNVASVSLTGAEGGARIENPGNNATLSITPGGAGITQVRVEATAVDGTVHPVVITVIVKRASPTSAIPDTSAGNQWQVVSGLYNGQTGNVYPAQTVTASPSTEETAAGYKYSEDGNVRVRKSIIATGTENQFYIRLSVDVRKPPLLQAVISNGDYWSTSNPQTVGQTYTKSGGNWKALHKEEESSKSKNPFTIVISALGQTFKTVRYPESNFANGTAYIALPNGQYFAIARAGHGENEIYGELSDSMVNDLLNAYGSVNLGTVTDTMGANITCEQGTTLTWPVVVDLKAATLDNSSEWIYDAAVKEYPITFTPQVGTGMADAGHVVDVINTPDAAKNATNAGATLTYHFPTEGADEKHSVDFPSPVVRGLLYDLQVKKTDSHNGNAVAGATFGVYKDAECTIALQALDGSPVTFTTNATGWGNVTNLLCGTYWVKELSAPTGYVVDATPRQFNLCYTNAASRALLAASVIDGRTTTDAMLAANTSTENPEEGTVVKNDRQRAHLAVQKLAGGSNAALAGAQFALYADDGDGVFDPLDKQQGDSCDVLASVFASYAEFTGAAQSVAASLETGTDGLARFFGLYVGENYWLVETRAPSGYVLLEQPVYIQVAMDGVYTVNASGQSVALKSSLSETYSGNTISFTRIAVTDEPVPVLPVTGGMGVGPYAALGMLALLGAGALGARLLREGPRRTRQRPYQPPGG